MLTLGVLLTGFGSGYYHWSPSNETLVWDRLPMTLTFLPMTALLLGVSKRTVFELCKTGQLHPRRIRRRKLFSRAELEAFANGESTK